RNSCEGIRPTGSLVVVLPVGLRLGCVVFERIVAFGVRVLTADFSRVKLIVTGDRQAARRACEMCREHCGANNEFIVFHPERMLTNFFTCDQRIGGASGARYYVTTARNGCVSRNEPKCRPVRFGLV